jgi:hypothetical protein
VVAVTAAWQFLSADDLAIGGAVESNVWGLVLATSGDVVYATGAHVYPAATLPGYVRTTTLQSIPSVTGAYPATRGSNAAAADTADPTVLGLGLSCDGGDYCKVPDGVLDSLTGRPGWTGIVLCRREAVGATHIMAGSISELTNNKTFMYFGAANTLTIGARVGATTKSGTSAGTYTDTAAWLCVAGIADIARSRVRGYVGATRVIDAAAAWGASAFDGTYVSGSAMFGGSGLAGSFVGTILAHAWYNRPLAPPEVIRAYRTLRCIWAARGVSVS